MHTRHRPRHRRYPYQSLGGLGWAWSPATGGETPRAPNREQAVEFSFFSHHPLFVQTNDRPLASINQILNLDTLQHAKQKIADLSVEFNESFQHC
jgi:hypothetical protein